MLVQVDDCKVAITTSWQQPPKSGDQLDEKTNQYYDVSKFIPFLALPSVCRSWNLRPAPAHYESGTGKVEPLCKHFSILSSYHIFLDSSDLVKVSEILLDHYGLHRRLGQGYRVHPLPSFRMDPNTRLPACMSLQSINAD
jgi:hypothetical protein